MRLMVNCETLLSFPTRTGLRVLSRWGRLRLATPARPAWFTVMVRVGLGHVGWWLLGTGAPSSSRAAGDGVRQGESSVQGELSHGLQQQISLKATPDCGALSRRAWAD